MLRFTKGMLLEFLLVALVCVPAHAATITTASCRYGDVAAAVGSAANGDTVIIASCPSGVSWSSRLLITKGITLQGQGPGNTVIVDNTFKGDSNCRDALDLILVTLSSDLPVEISGFTINGIPGQFNCGASAGHIHVHGKSHQFRVDNITFNLQATGINVTGDSWGVIDHNTFNDGANKFAVMVQHNSWQNVGNYGDNSWAQPDTFGQAGAVYIETNTFNFTDGDSAPPPVGCIDAGSGGRLVFRHNVGCPYIEVHGLDSSGRNRSVRHYEIYDNTFRAQVNVLQNMHVGVHLRGGTGLIFHNEFNDVSGSRYVGLVGVYNYRDTNNAWAPWGHRYNGWGCDGRSDFDTNTDKVYLSGSYDGEGGETEVLTDTSQHWAANQWTSYSAINLTKGWGSAIGSNTTTTITTEAATQGTSHSWSKGDSYEIRKAYPCADQIGRGAGVKLSGANAVPAGPVKQAADPIYEWLNKHNSTPEAAIHSANPQHVAPNRDFYNWTGSFNGSSGTGAGTLSARPSTCTPMVAYWAIDTAILYQCSATNTWTPYYKPYTYPHPLTKP